MSEPQTEFETERETDAEPTPGPWEVKDDGFCPSIHARNSFDSIAAVLLSADPNSARDAQANARLIAAAGTAAQEAKEMGYDPQRAVEALSKGLESVRRAIIDLQEAHTSGPPEDSAEAAAQAASHRLKVFMAEAGADESMIPGHASVALASAEGSEE